MKKLPLLLALLVLPAWAADAAGDRGMNVELKGPAKSVAALVADLEKDAAYKDAGCAAKGKPGKTARISCAKAEGALLTALKAAPGDVRWSVSSAAAKPVAAPAAAAAPLSAQGCAVGCSYMKCPPPNGVPMCCNISTYKAC